MRRLMPQVMVVLVWGWSGLSWGGDDSIINEYLEKNREAGAGPGVVISKAKGELGYDSKPAVAVLYVYQIGESRDRSHAQYLAVLEPSPPKKFSPPIRVGLGGLQTFNEVSIENRIITLRGKRWAQNDPACCPSEEAVLQLSYSGDGFIPLAVSPNTPPQPTRTPIARPAELSR